MNVFEIATLPIRVADSVFKQVTGRKGSSEPKQGMNDQTLKAKVESTLFRLPGVSRSKVNVTVTGGRVTLRGEARNAASVNSIETALRSIPEVTEIENLLHQPKTPARSAAKPASAPKRTPRVNRDKTSSSDAQPKPVDLAAKREGRKAAPLGSTDTPSDASTTPPTKSPETEPPGTAGSPKTPTLSTGKSSS